MNKKNADIKLTKAYFDLKIPRDFDIDTLRVSTFSSLWYSTCVI